MTAHEKAIEAATKRVCCPDGCCNPSICHSYQVKDVTDAAIAAYTAALKGDWLAGELLEMAAGFTKDAVGQDIVMAKLNSKECRIVADLLRTAAARIAGQDEVRYQHRKGGFYYVLCEGTFESNLLPVVIYRAETDGTVWVRSKAEFYDGRFAAAPKETNDIDELNNAAIRKLKAKAASKEPNYGR